MPVQPSVMYYMWRTLATVLDDFRPAEFQVRIPAEKKLLWFTFQREIQEKMIAVWLAHPAVNSTTKLWKPEAM